MNNEDKGAAHTSFFSLVTGQENAGLANKKTRSELASSAGDTASKAGPRTNELAPSAGNAASPGDSLPIDSSDMPHDARRVLVHLMRQGTVIAAQKPKLFAWVCRYEAYLRRHLSEVYLQLVLDQKSGVAFVATQTSEHGDDGAAHQGDDESLDDFATLISKRTLSLFDTLILLVLRKHYQDRESAGEQKITIDIDRLESYLTPFLPITDHASKDRKKLLARVKEMVKRKILSTIRGTEDRYEITPIIRYVVSASFLESMLAEYTALASNPAGEYLDTSSHAQNSVVFQQGGEHE